MNDLPDLDLPDLKRIRRDIPDAEADANSKKLAQEWLGGERPELSSLRIEVPKYVQKALGHAAAERSVTKQYLILEALMKTGYPVQEEDLIEDKRRFRKR
jgi:hypothetical protein